MTAASREQRGTIQDGAHEMVNDEQTPAPRSPGVARAVSKWG